MWDVVGRFMYRYIDQHNGLSKDVILASGRLLLILGLALPDVYYNVQTLNAQCVHPMLVKKNASCYSGGTRTHNLLLSSTDVLTT